ncbi:hypothetical protein SK128_019696 [Halocaridina rubra]|uniref:Tantalus-like domain-containing protein n=1 Tax=Halocaridina rubra TaxID=373956 RepID=A0AAN8XA53_HALRR
MESTSEIREGASTRTQSLRTRQRQVNYEESNDDLEEESSNNCQAKGKKRGSKRKAEMTIESLYCQENVKVITPSLLETIFESPKKVLTGRRSTASRHIDSCDKSVEDQVMSLKKLRRFCAFSNYYYPTKQKNKIRKDRAKKLKQLTGVKVPKGVISNEALLTALSGLAEGDELNEVSEKNIYENVCQVSTDKELCDETRLTFYEGNVIKPDVENVSLEEVTKNMSCMHMENKLYDVDMSEDFMKDLEKSLLFTNENINPNVSLPKMKQKKSRRRSQKYHGNLLPLINDDEECPNVVSDQSKDSWRTEISETLENEKVKSTSNTSKRRNGLSDLKVVKKTKHFELSLKRENESSDEKCLKKRGHLHSDSTEPCPEGKNTLDSQMDPIALNALEDILSSVNVSVSCEELSMERTAISCDIQSEHKRKGSGRGKKSRKRRVSGIQRPLYRTLPEVISPGSEQDSFEDRSPAYHDELKPLDHSAEDPSFESISPNTCRNGNSSLETVSQCSNLLNVPSLSPCSQMAALSLNSSNGVQPRPFTRSQRRSLGLSVKLVDGTSNSSNHLSKLSSPLTSPHYIHTKIGNRSQESGRKRGKRLSNVCSRVEEQTDSSIGGKHYFTADEISKKTTSWKSERNSANDTQSSIDIKPDVALANTGSSVPTTIAKDLQHVHESDALVKSNLSLFMASENECKVRPTIDQSSSPNFTPDVVIKKANELSAQLPSQDCPLRTKLDEQIGRESDIGSNSRNDKCDLGSADKHLDDMLEQQEMVEMNSPVISGMLENKAMIRFGRVYKNQQTFVSSPITGEHLLGINCNYESLPNFQGISKS